MSNTNTAQAFTEWYTAVSDNLEAMYKPMVTDGLLTAQQVQSILNAHRSGAQQTWLHLVGKV